MLQNLNYSTQAILIAGPTASGKSALAISLARQINGVIINADSMQVYRDLRVLSARPSEAEAAEADHRLYGFVEARTEYSVGDYLRDVKACLDEARLAGKTPIFVGGTGLYFKALTQGLIQTPAIPPEIRARLYAEGEAGIDLHARLMGIDPAIAVRFEPANHVRIIRALEVYEATGKTMTDWQNSAHSEPLLAPETWCGIFLSVERGLLKERIHQRFETMIEAGALDEVRGLMALNLPVNRGIMKAHGVPHLAAHLRDEMPLSEAIDKGQMDTRRYAKRQHTFARGQLPEFMFMSLEQVMGFIMDAFPNLSSNRI